MKVQCFLFKRKVREMYFDTHTHLNDEAFLGKEEEYVARAKENGVTKMAIVGCNQETNAQSLALSTKFPELYSIIGFHPTDIKEYNEQTEQQLEAQLAEEKVVALGEIGVDYYWMEDPKEEQEKIFRRQLAIARNLHLPVSIHTRSKEKDSFEAYEDVYRILKEEKVPGIIHSFNGNVEWMERFLDLGMHISFSGVVTFKNAKMVQEAAKKVPKEAFLIETDAPYLAPVPKRGKQNEPAYVRYVAEYIADLRAVTPEEIAKQTMHNACTLFGIEEEK